MRINRRAVIGGVAAALMAAPALAEVPVQCPAPPTEELDVIRTPLNVTLPLPIPGRQVIVQNSGGSPISVYGSREATLTILREGEGRTFMAFSDLGWRAGWPFACLTS